MTKAFCSLLLAIYASSVFAGETLQPIHVTDSRNEGLVTDKCIAAYQQLVQDRLDIEGKEGFDCIRSLDSKFMEQILAEFMIDCRNTVSGSTTGDASVDQLKTAFRTAYGPYIKDKCEAREQARIQSMNAYAQNRGGGSFTWAPADNGAGQAYREGCYRGSGCR